MADLAGLLGQLLGGQGQAPQSSMLQEGATGVPSAQPTQGEVPGLTPELLGEEIDVEPLVSDQLKGMFASTETSNDITGDWLQLEPGTFKDLKKRGLIDKDIDFEGLSDDPEVYDEVARAYIDDLMTTFKIPTEQEAALWSYRPGWYKKYDGNISKIPASAGGSHGKSGRKVMQDREVNLNKYLETVE